MTSPPPSGEVRIIIEIADRQTTFPGLDPQHENLQPDSTTGPPWVPTSALFLPVPSLPGPFSSLLLLLSAVVVGIVAGIPPSFLFLHLGRLGAVSVDSSMISVGFFPHMCNLGHRKLLIILLAIICDYESSEFFLIEFIFLITAGVYRKDETSPQSRPDPLSGRNHLAHGQRPPPTGLGSLGGVPIPIWFVGPLSSLAAAPCRSPPNRPKSPHVKPRHSAGPLSRSSLPGPWGSSAPLFLSPSLLSKGQAHPPQRWKVLAQILAGWKSAAL